MKSRRRQRGPFRPIGVRMRDFGRRLMRHYVVVEDLPGLTERPTPWQTAAQLPLIWPEPPPEVVAPETPEAEAAQPDLPTVETPRPEPSPRVRRQPRPQSQPGENKLDPRLLKILDAHQQVDAEREKKRQEKLAAMRSAAEVQRQTGDDQSMDAPSPPVRRRSRASFDYVETSALKPQGEETPDFSTTHHAPEASTSEPAETVQRQAAPAPEDAPDVDWPGPDYDTVEQGEDAGHPSDDVEGPADEADQSESPPLNVQRTAESTLSDGPQASDQDVDDYYNASFETQYDVQGSSWRSWEDFSEAEPDEAESGYTDAAPDASTDTSGRTVEPGVVQRAAQPEATAAYSEPPQDYDAEYDSGVDVGEVSEAGAVQRAPQPASRPAEAGSVEDTASEPVDDVDDYYSRSFDTQIDIQAFRQPAWYDADIDSLLDTRTDDEPVDEGEQSVGLFEELVDAGVMPSEPAEEGPSVGVQGDAAWAGPRSMSDVQRSPQAAEVDAYSDEPDYELEQPLDAYEDGGETEVFLRPTAFAETPPSTARPSQVQRAPEVEQDAYAEEPAYDVEQPSADDYDEEPADADIVTPPSAGDVQRSSRGLDSGLKPTVASTTPDDTSYVEDEPYPAASTQQPVDLYEALVEAGAVEPDPHPLAPSPLHGEGEQRSPQPEPAARSDSEPSEPHAAQSLDLYEALVEAGAVEGSDAGPMADGFPMTSPSRADVQRTPEAEQDEERRLDVSGLLDLLNAAPPPREESRRPISYASPSRSDAPVGYSAPPDRVMREESPGPSESSGTSSVSSEEEGQGEADIDKLARDVYRELRKRLRIEQERGNRSRRS